MLWLVACIGSGGLAVGTPDLVVPESVLFTSDVLGSTASLVLSNVGTEEAWVTLTLVPQDSGFGVPSDPFNVAAGETHEAVVSRLEADADLGASVLVDAVYAKWSVTILSP